MNDVAGECVVGRALLSLVCCRINGNDTCTELLLESKGSVIVNLPDAKGRSAYLVTCYRVSTGPEILSLVFKT